MNKYYWAALGATLTGLTLFAGLFGWLIYIVVTGVKTAAVASPLAVGLGWVPLSVMATVYLSCAFLDAGNAYREKVNTL